MAPFEDAATGHARKMFRMRTQATAEQPQQHIDTQTTQIVSVRMIPKYFCRKEKCERDGLGKVRLKFS